MTSIKTRRKVVFEHDNGPDFSWLEQDHYNPDHPSYDPVYRTQEEMEAGKELDGNWYRNPDNHVALAMLVLELGEDDDDWKVVDSLGGIDFLADSDDWQTGTFYRLQDIKDGYLRELARAAGLS